MQSRYTFYICPTYPVYCNLFSSMHHEFFIFVIYIRHRSLIHLLWQKSFLHDSLHDVLHCRATLPMFLAYNLRFYQRRGSFMQMCLNTVFYRGSNICTILLSLSSNQWANLMEQMWKGQRLKVQAPRSWDYTMLI